MSSIQFWSSFCVFHLVLRIFLWASSAIWTWEFTFLGESEVPQRKFKLHCILASKSSCIVDEDHHKKAVGGWIIFVEGQLPGSNFSVFLLQKLRLEQNIIASVLYQNNKFYFPCFLFILWLNLILKYNWTLFMAQLNTRTGFYLPPFLLNLLPNTDSLQFTEYWDFVYFSMFILL